MPSDLKKEANMSETLTFSYMASCTLYTRNDFSNICTKIKRLVIRSFPSIQILDILLIYDPENQADICNNEALLLRMKAILSKYFSLLL
jgi:type III secretory pathway lipoprotein EscJ